MASRQAIGEVEVSSRRQIDRRLKLGRSWLILLPGFPPRVHPTITLSVSIFVLKPSGDRRLHFFGGEASSLDHWMPACVENQRNVLGDSKAIH
jgi:hypothetical protein